MKNVKLKKVVKTLKRPLQKVNAEEKKNTEETLKGKDRFKEVIKPYKMEISEKEDLVFSVTEDQENGDVKVDIRVFLTTDKYQGPTKRGITFQLEDLDQVRDILYQIDNRVYQLDPGSLEEDTEED